MMSGPHFSRFCTAAVFAAAMAAPSQSAQAQQWIAQLSGAAEEPPNASPGIGTMRFTLVDATTLRIYGSFSGLLSPTVAAHIHCCTADALAGTAGVATTTPTFATFPNGVQSGSFDYLMDLENATSFRPAFLAASGGTTATAWSRLQANMNSGNTYFNIHTTDFPGGEIRGFITAVPEPSTYLLVATGLGALLLRRRRGGRPG